MNKNQVPKLQPQITMIPPSAQPPRTQTPPLGQVWDVCSMTFSIVPVPFEDV